MSIKANLPNTLQFVVVAVIVVVLVGMATTAHDNLVRQGVATGFTFLFDRTGWDVSSSLLPQAPADPYWWTFAVGLANTVLLSVVCIVLATAGGLVLALLGAGESRILRGLTRLYVWIFRNIPVIVQVFFWYHMTRQFPPVRQATEFWGCCYASNRGLYIPALGLEPKPVALVGLAVAFAASLFGFAVLNSRRRASNERPLGRVIQISAALGVGFLVFVALVDFKPSLPRLQGFNFVGGSYLSPEFIALVVALVAYNIAFIAEIINSGIRSVPRSQIEAARVIGLSNQRTFWRITIPQAIRVAIPPLINQYISLIKSTSLAVAIGYTDLFSIGVVAINHTGQSINIIALLMLIYLALSLGLSTIGNAYNRAMTAPASR
jgi:general L-amino acid transport system permease protein